MNAAINQYHKKKPEYPTVLPESFEYGSTELKAYLENGGYVISK